jgi:hypothetical protein
MVLNTDNLQPCIEILRENVKTLDDLRQAFAYIVGSLQATTQAYDLQHNWREGPPCELDRSQMHAALEAAFETFLQGAP